MIKTFQLIYVQLLSLFEVNKMIKRTKENESLDIKALLFLVVAFFYGYVFYTLLRAFFSDGYVMLTVTFFFCTLFCFLYDFSQVKALLFQSEDTLFLFSLPVGRKEIVVSKLFLVYLKNMFFVVLFMTSSLLAANDAIHYTQTFLLLYVVMSMFIPLVPIVVSSMITYFYHHFSVQHSTLFKVFLFFLICCLSIPLLFHFHLSLENLSVIYQKCIFFYPIAFLFSNTLLQLNPFFFFVYVVIHISVFYVYVFLLSSNYQSLCSLIRGRKKRMAFVYKKRRNKKRFFGFIQKEFVYLFSYFLYFKSSFYFSILGSILLILLCLLFPFSSYPSFSKYFSLFGPILLTVFISTGISTIHAFSLERKHLDMLGSFPISFDMIFFSKLFVNIFIGCIFLLIDATFLTLLWKPNRVVTIMLYVLPLATLIFNSFLSLLLDCRFVDRKNQSESAIIKQRLLPIIPLSIAFAYLIFPFFFPNILGYSYMLGAYLCISVLGIIVCFLYYFLARKKLRNSLFYDTLFTK